MIKWVAGNRQSAVLLIPAAVLMGVSTSACMNDYVVFTTSTRFAVDISQQADQPPKVLLGYKREEGMMLPAEHQPALAIDPQEEVKSDLLGHATSGGAGQKDGASMAKEATSTNNTKKTIRKASRTDTYSTLSYLCIMTNPSLWDFIRALSPTSKNVPDGLQIRAFFATGMAAQRASENNAVLKYYEKAATPQPDRAEKRCF
jgi:hypothetical protein